MSHNYPCFLCAFLLTMFTYKAEAALSLDRTRIVFNQGNKAVSLRVTNQNNKSPYLAQSWIEDASGKKINMPLVSLPPIQRIEAGSETKVRLQFSEMPVGLPTDKESLFYFYFREIPPKTNKPNSVMLAVESKLKVFYRPESIVVDKMQEILPGLENITLDKDKKKYEINNVTPYYLTIVEARESQSAKPISFESVMYSPKSRGFIPDNVSTTGNKISLVIVTDYGEQRSLNFLCENTHCHIHDIGKIAPKKNAHN
ncbi:molecular chaperone [Hafnia alvei]|uniref:fimbrial biogenesis chaperone n=1 Tax=Hafnia alvei TaxID=569 RepID=UPI00345D98CD